MAASLRLSLQQMLLFFVVFAAFFFSCCFSVYEDQVGLWDWHQQYIGKVKYAAFQTQGAGRKRVVVATEQNVLASLNLRKGEIFWKHVLGDSDHIDGLEIVLGKYVLTLSQQGSMLRAWHLPDGQLVWETSLQPPGSNPMLRVTSVDLGKGKLVLVVGSKLLYGISSIDGELLWTKESSELSDSGEINIKKVVQSDDKKNLYGVGFVGSSGFSVWDLDAKTGHLNSRKLVSFQGDLSIENLVITDFSAIGIDAKGQNIAIVSIKHIDQPVIHVASIKHLIPGGLGKPHLLEETLDGIFALQFSNQITLVKLGSSHHDLEVVQTFEGPAAISKGVELPGSKGALSVVQQVTDEKITVHILMDEGGERKVYSELVQLGPQKGLVQGAYVNDYIRHDRSHGFRVLIVTEDSSLSLLQQGEVVWSREDGLAGIIEASTAELPLEKEGVSVAQVEHSLVEWLKGHWVKLKTTLMLASPEEVAVVQALRLKSADKSKMTRDHNGFRKLLIVLTEAGKLYALHTGDGRIVWSLLIAGFRSSSTSGEILTMLKLLPWQVPHKHALDENPVFLLAAKHGSETNQVGILAWVDASSGKELKSTKLTYFIEQIIPLPFTDSAEQRLHLIIDDHANAHLFPSTDESLQIFQDHVPNTYFHMIDEEKGTITGFVVKGPEAVSAVSPSDGFFFRSQKLWTIMFPSDSEKIITTATRRPDEAVHTQAKVLTNQEVLFKYLNKNSLFVATVAPRGSETIGETSPEENWLVVYVIDTVTGRILHRLKHPNMHGPVHAVFSENWIVYHYFNVLAHRFEISVLEMYDEHRIDTKNLLQVMLGRHNATAPVSSFSHVDLDVKAQSYFFLHSVKALTVTTTARGITGKQILVGSVNDQVLALDKRLFDPRRSPNPTSAEREDGIIPLTDAIPIHPQSYLTHAYQVEGLRGIISVPASLESTSLVFAYGVDLFYTHTAPSRIYDSLTEDFNYALLLITIVVLLIAIVTTWILSERKELKEKWK
eukprot:c20782_g1_i1 orf=468-3470(-)